MRKTWIALTLAGLTAGALGAPGTTASAAPQECVTTTISPGDGTYGTIGIKSSSSTCHGLSLTHAYNPGRLRDNEYAGMYQTSSGWKFGSAGYFLVRNGSYPVGQYVLVPELEAGTPFSVASGDDDGVPTVEITH
ncbi:hypothetical protein [Streptomyces sp. CBMA152]|uniref:hypothetical protein n=1 Tax=Streptomyces sp. CBMA152 TaxID=1896312 RepID=UPI0016603AC7|nr:hypothetical protein [Streptomyces sp. CBMA152]MBD0741407.1 hypothetical protein [Streptomyces sp. CBMA152]